MRWGSAFVRDAVWRRSLRASMMRPAAEESVLAAVDLRSDSRHVNRDKIRGCL
jgi:hypothetical protein